MEQIVTSQDLRWKIENEQHWFQATCNDEEHTVILHNTHGPCFPAHYAGMTEMLMESKFLGRHEWGCHYLARWWAGERDFWSCNVYSEAGMVHIVLDTRDKERVVTLIALPVAGFFFVRKLRLRSPHVAVCWGGLSPMR